MDLNSLISYKKHKKDHVREEKGDRSIRICDLPDHILQLIISSLPMKDAIRTCVISRRWRHIWRGISKIELVEGKPEKRQQFIDFVRRLLVVCECSGLKKFSLSCEVDEDASQVNEWLHHFINPKIQELSLDLKGIEKPLVFPNHMFTCASLKTLTLKNITFPDSYSTQQLFSGCLSLEELTLIDCNWVNVKVVYISSPLLQKIFIRDSKDNHDDDSSDEDDDISGQNVTNCCKVVVVGTNLKSFSYEGDHRNDYLLHSSTSVINASINVNPPYYWSEFSGKGWLRDAASFAFKLLTEFSSMESLSISEIALMAISSTSLQGHLPLFSNLAQLCVVSVFPTQLTWEAFQSLLQNSPCLQVLNFGGGVSLPNDCAKYILEPLPMCFRTQLKTIKIHGLIGYKEELHAIKILLQSASVLAKLHICFSSFVFTSYYEKKKLQNLCKQIRRFPRGSADCEIDFKEC